MQSAKFIWHLLCQASARTLQVLAFTIRGTEAQAMQWGLVVNSKTTTKNQDFWTPAPEMPECLHKSGS